MELNTTWTLSPLFEGIRDEENLRSWLMRVYFNPAKHTEERYYRTSVTKENVLEYVSHPENKFPQTPMSISEVWSVLPGLREGLKSVVIDEAADKPGNYIKGEMTLAEIGQKLGPVPITAAMVNKISDTATIKLSALLKALGAENKWLAKEAEERLDNARVSTAIIFADALMAQNAVSDVIDQITKAKLVTWADVSQVCDHVEKEAIQNLLDTKAEGATKEDFIEIIEQDLLKSVNVFNLAQLCVSRQIFPPGKRGRRKGTQNAEQED